METEYKLPCFQDIIMKPFVFNDLRVNLIDAFNAPHPINWTDARHKHIWFEFNFVRSGSCYTTINGIEYRVNSGYAYIIPPGCYHEHRHCESIGDTGFCLRWSMELSKKCDTDEFAMLIYDRLHSALTSKDLAPFPFDGEGFLKRMESKQIISIQFAFIEFLMELCRTSESLLCQDQMMDEMVNDAQWDKLMIRHALLYLEDLRSGELNVYEMAASLNISYRHLSRLFKQVTGTTIAQRYNDIRIERAKKLLRETNLLNKEVASQVGFKNENYFSTLFKQVTTLSPGEYRQKSRFGMG